MTGRPPVNGNASVQAKELLSYLYDLSNQDSGMLTGQHNWLGAPTANITNLVLPISEGKYPAISSFELGAIGGQSNEIVQSQRTETINAAVEYWRAGGIPAFSWHQQFPLTTNTWANVWNDTNKTNGYKTQAEFNLCITPGTSQYNWLLAEYDKVADHLKVLKNEGVPVLFRAYHEMNGYWFWWGMKSNYKALWELIYNRLVVHHDLNNLLFVWNTHCPRASDPYIKDFRLYYPGTVSSGVIGTDGKVDVITHDIYNGEFLQSHHDNLWYFGGGKPIGLSEVGGLPNMQTMQSSQYRYAFSIAWGENYWSDENTDANKRQYYSSAYALTREEVDMPALDTPTPVSRRLQVSGNGRFLVTSDSAPFFWMADTAWETIQRLTRAEVITYLNSCAEQGFNVVQVVALAETWNRTVPNANGDQPLVGTDPSNPLTTTGSDPSNATQYDFWDHADFVIDTAASLGIYVALLPTWGKYIIDNSGSPYNQPYQGIFNNTNAYNYGRWLGARYASKNSIIWVLGGDRAPDTDPKRQLIRQMAQGIQDGGGTQLTTFHPIGTKSSSEWFQNDAWLDFNMYQSGHATIDLPNYNGVTADYAKTPVKPVLDAEPRYENAGINFSSANGRFTAYDVRQAAYWSVFAGSFGHTYGHGSIWQMYAPGRTSDENVYWYDALTAAGRTQMKYVRMLMESRPFLDRVPDQSLVTNALSGGDHIQATRGSSYAMIYTRTSLTINMGKISGTTVTAYWYNPRTGANTLIGDMGNTGTRSFTPPSIGRNNDWVLVIDDKSKGYLPPGEDVTTPPPVDTTPPTAPGNLTLVSKTANSVTMSWTAATDASGIEVYDIYRDGVYFGFTSNLSNLQFTATGLTPNTSYTFTVRAKDTAQNWGPFSNPLVVTTDTSSGTDTTPPTAPGNLTLVSKTSTSVTMSWTAATDASGIEVYDIYRNGVYFGYTQNFANLQFTAAGLTASTSYTFTVRAKDTAQNWGPFSNPLVVTTDASSGTDTTPPTAPGNLTLVSKTSTSVTMSWTAATDASGIEVYDIYRNGVYFGYTTNLANLQFTAAGLTPNTSYTFTVKAKDKAQNWGPFSNPLVVTTDSSGTDTTPPTAPSNLSLVSKTSTAVTMRWTAATDASGIEVYAIYRNGVYFGFTSNLSNLQFTATGLSPNTSYTFTVRAKDKAQNWGPSSNSLAVRTNVR